MAGNSLRVICGPTGAGKSAIALWLAERHGGAIVSADSRQIYRGFDIGTAKPTEHERRQVPHYGIDILKPTERYSAARWAHDAEAWIAESRVAGRTPVVVGGTGFYLRALFVGLFSEPELDTGRRTELATVTGRMSTAELRRWCERLDPDRAGLGRTQLLRALEIALLTGRSMSDWHREPVRPPTFTARYLLVDPGSALAERLVNRMDAMLAAGWLAEARRLSEFVAEDAPAWKATGYGVMRSVTRGELSPEVARERVMVDTRQYAKRQRTWFRNQLAGARVTMLDPARADWRHAVDAWWLGAEEV